MDARKKKRLEAAGWRVGTAEDFLELDAAEAALVELKLGLSEALRARRTAKRLSQAQLAKRLGSSQSRVAKMEAADQSVSLDLLLRGLLVLGATLRDVAKLIRDAGARVAA
jgi:ribosome-binding protein aMBF1 (putative translation factor)